MLELVARVGLAGEMRTYSYMRKSVVTFLAKGQAFVDSARECSMRGGG
jgi:hypothetical protein